MPPAAPFRTPRYAQIAQVLKSRLAARETAGTGPFATEHALCEEFGVSRTTVRQALGFLKREGLITSRAGVGTNGTATEIANRVVRSSGDPLHGMLKSKPHIVSLGRAAAPAAVAKFFSIQPGEEIFRITRVHDLDAIPLSVVRSYLPAQLAVGLPRSAWRRPMHDLLWERFGLRLARSVHRLCVARAEADIASMLAIGLAEPVLRIQASTYLADGRAIRWTENFFREDRYEYVAEMQWPAPHARRHKPASDNAEKVTA
jgi:DNA-binding GntR family transcriptional regulator